MSCAHKKKPGEDRGWGGRYVGGEGGGLGGNRRLAPVFNFLDKVFSGIFKLEAQSLIELKVFTNE